MESSAIQEIIEKQKDYYRYGHTHDVSFRLKQLSTLKKAIHKHEREIIEAVKKDMGKPKMEGFLSEVAFTISEIELALKNLKSWAKPQKIKIPIAHLPGSSYIYTKPYGVTLIMGPWNYPFHLLVAPLVGAMAAGNCAVLKPSEITPHTSALTAQIFKEHFDPRYIAVVEGGPEESQALLNEKWDYIFFTGGTEIGQKVMEAASKNLTPVTLELGGKSPCIVDKEVRINIAARRIAWGKFFNAGQTCVAPDYVLVQEEVKDKFLAEFEKCIHRFFGNDVEQSPDFARIVNERHFDRLAKLLENTKIAIGGEMNRENKYISPTVVDGIDWDHPIMQEEIFGPILPVLKYQDLDQAIQRVNDQPKPLAFYFFSDNERHQKKILDNTISGGICINDTLSHIIPNALPFGGIGPSGMGNYHGKASFDTFSHKRSMLKKSTAIDIKNRYAPYKMSIRQAKMILKFLTG